LLYLATANGKFMNSFNYYCSFILGIIEALNYPIAEEILCSLTNESVAFNNYPIF
jgi:hypothetical protein